MRSFFSCPDGIITDFCGLLTVGTFVDERTVVSNISLIFSKEKKEGLDCSKVHIY